jgi:hypothetical protein
MSTVIIDLGMTSISGSSGGIERDLEVANTLAGAEQFLLRWNNLSYTTTTFVGGLFANFLVLGLGLYIWLVAIAVIYASNFYLVMPVHSS